MDRRFSINISALALATSILRLPIASPQESEPQDEWQPTPGAPTWVINYPPEPKGDPKNDKKPPAPKDLAPGEIPEREGEFGVSPNGNGFGGTSVSDDFLGLIIQRVTVTWELGDCEEIPIDSDGDGVSDDFECGFSVLDSDSEFYFEIMQVYEDTTTVASPQMESLDTFSIPTAIGGQGVPYDGREVTLLGEAKFIPGSYFDTDLADAEALLNWPGWSSPSDGQDTHDVEGLPMSSGEFENSRTPPPGWDSDFGGNSKNMPAHSLSIRWQKCRELPGCREYFDFSQTANQQ